ncbi:hypothetical protein [Marinimicrobium sp. ABcell2]|uniref:hypothetical protein n=1 Tax=Marinimicrobium sp. ABcell2 TaxID=3069751 RepID=UPI0027AE6FD1|nr:hypothetical protein [Marinimicrobium sp. ABcell2]MDQ2076872.1 hypothetical protein [Marinimicrobium sp. ABcell2]
MNTMKIKLTRFFQSQPVGPGPFFRPAALSVAYLALPNRAPSALLDKKLSSGSDHPIGANRPLTAKAS